MTQRILIIGATSAIAAEVARIYASPSRGARLHLLGRSSEKMHTLCSSLAGATVTSELADFARLENASALIERAVAQLGGLDVALIAHGTLGDQLRTEQSFDEAEAIFRDNLLSAVAFVVPIANVLEAQRGGTLGVITSVAGERGRPRNYTYGAAKGALNIYLQGVRSRLYRSGAHVVTLKLGPVDTPMTVSHPKNVLFARPRAVAESIVAALDAKRTELYVPWFWGAIMPFVKHAPERLFQLFPFLSGR
ncbi:MAG TPA: SDR family NAD(P)-dependent oxidoreductase [Polyangiaceae bacterium]|nr:SDR family NAD(P)-dependent oxidoreductase [Polyangiaceae bacterium]